MQMINSSKEIYNLQIINLAIFIFNYQPHTPFYKNYYELMAKTQKRTIEQSFVKTDSVS